MKKIFILLTLLLAITCSSAMAYPTFVMDGSENLISFMAWENLVDTDSSGAINPGDYFFGIISAQNIFVNGGYNWFQGTTDQFSGYFLTEVISTADITGDSIPDIQLGPRAAGDPYGKLNTAAGEVMKLWADSSSIFEANGSVLDDISKATDGTVWGSFTTNGGYWYSPTAPGVNTVGLNYAGLNFVQAPFLVNKVNDPSEVLKNNNVDVYFNSEITSQTGPWSFFVNDPAVVAPIPEPGSMLLLGMGILGLFGLGRKKT